MPSDSPWQFEHRKFVLIVWTAHANCSARLDHRTLGHWSWHTREVAYGNCQRFTWLLINSSSLRPDIKTVFKIKIILVRFLHKFYIMISYLFYLLNQSSIALSPFLFLGINIVPESTYKYDMTLNRYDLSTKAAFRKMFPFSIIFKTIGSSNIMIYKCIVIVICFVHK